MAKVDENKEGIKGMVNPTRYGIERFAYLLMRLTGLGLLAYFVAHIYETSNILRGKVGWQEFLAITQTPEGHIILAIVIGMSVFHTVNGLRVILLELKQGPTFEKSVSYGCIAAMALIILYGSRTIFMTSMGMV